MSTAPDPTLIRSWPASEVCPGRTGTDGVDGRNDDRVVDVSGGLKSVTLACPMRLSFIQPKG